MAEVNNKETSFISISGRDAALAVVTLVASILGPASIVSYQIVASMSEVKTEIKQVRSDVNRLALKIDSVDTRVTDLAIGLADLRGETRGRLASKEAKEP